MTANKVFEKRRKEMNLNHFKIEKMTGIQSYQIKLWEEGKKDFYHKNVVKLLEAVDIVLLYEG